MKNNHVNQRGQNSEKKLYQPSVEIKKESPEKKPGIIDPKRNDPTRNDKLPLIISKL